MTAELKGLDGSTFKLEDKKGKVLLVNLWATWCGPCRAEMPELIALQDKYRDQGFEVIGLDTDENETPEQIKEFVEDMKLNYTIGMTDQKFFNEFVKLTRQPAIPQSMIINREGKMTGLFTGSGEQLLEKLKKTVEKTVTE
ncbi:MAG: TlpA disulfide reductase family protein [Pyrinomonadaceae bacterium]